jgi:hypothetical protein
MIQGGENLRLASESREAIGIDGELVGHHFDRDVAIELRVARAKHFAHAARSDEGQDLERAETCSGRERHAGFRKGL